MLSNPQKALLYLELRASPGSGGWIGGGARDPVDIDSPRGGSIPTTDAPAPQGDSCQGVDCKELENELVQRSTAFAKALADFRRLCPENPSFIISRECLEAWRKGVLAKAALMETVSKIEACCMLGA